MIHVQAHYTGLIISMYIYFNSCIFATSLALLLDKNFSKGKVLVKMAIPKANETKDST